MSAPSLGKDLAALWLEMSCFSRYSNKLRQASGLTLLRFCSCWEAEDWMITFSKENQTLRHNMSEVLLCWNHSLRCDALGSGYEWDQYYSLVWRGTKVPTSIHTSGDWCWHPSAQTVFLFLGDEAATADISWPFLHLYSCDVLCCCLLFFWGV